MNIRENTANLLNDVRKTIPLIHNITNYVTVNDVANAVLAIGASPIMADAIEESEDITAISSALVLNIGTLNKRTVDSMVLSGKKANEMNIPVVFDPVGAGASAFRNQTTQRILSEVKIDILRGNLSEISFVAGLEVATKGVDSALEDEKNDAVKVANEVAARLDCVVAITGAVDVIADGTRTVKLNNGHPMLSKVTGTGCMTSAIVGAYAGAGKDYFTAAIGGVASMGIAGEIAYTKAEAIGTGTFHINIIDALSRLDREQLLKRIKMHEA